MTNAKVQPCLRRIDADCFRHHPTWAKQAVAYRLVHLLTPKPLTKRLPKALRTPLIAPGVVVPPGVDLPAGIVIGPGTVVPAAWKPADPLPAGIIIAPGTVFPDGWTVGDPIPDGITMEPGATFPPGWLPADPLPPGALPAVVTPPGAQDTGAIAPVYGEPWSPGPPTPTKPPPPVSPWTQYTGEEHWTAGVGCDFLDPGWRFTLSYPFSNGILWVNTRSVWAAGYRPTLIYIDYTGTAITRLEVRDSYPNDLAVPSSSPYTSEEERPLDFSPDLDIKSILIRNGGGVTDIHTIGFYLA